MKVKSIGEAMVETERPIEVELSNGVRYRITENKFGELEIMNCRGKMAICPSVSNVVYIKSIE